MPYQHPPIELRGSAPIIGSGPIASAPDAETWWNKAPGKIGGLYYNTGATADTPVGPCVPVRSFHNEGADYGDWGRPADLISLINGRNYVCETVGRLNISQTFVAFVQLGTSPNIEMSISVGNSSTTRWFAVGTGSAPSVGSIPIGRFSQAILVASGTTYLGYINGSLVVSASAGAQTSTANLILTAGASFGNNLEGDLLLACFRNSSGQCVACFNANDPNQWNGGTSATDSAGNPITFTDGSPTGIVAYRWVNLYLAQEWGILT